MSTGKAGKVLVKDFGGCSQDAVIIALKERGLWPASSNDSAPRSRRQETRYEVRYARGDDTATHVRIDTPTGKIVWWEQDGTKGLKRGSPSDFALWRSEQLQALVDGGEVVACEGERATDALQYRGNTAVGTFGTSAHPCDDSLRPLLRLRVLLWPDNDDVGREHMQKIAHALHRLGHRDLHLVRWPDAPDKGDAADFTGDNDALRQLLDSTVKWAPAPAVDLAELLNNVKTYITKYVVLTDAQADALALWTAHTHALDAAETTPYIEVTSAEKRSGKSRLLETVEHVVKNPWLTGRTSAAALVRKMGEGVTALNDESDAAFNGPQEYSEALRGILNNGHRRGGVATLCVGQGANIEVKDFPVFGPKMIAGIGGLPDTIADRSIKIVMQRRTPREQVARLRRRDAASEAEPIKTALLAWAVEAVPILTDARPEIPVDLDDRAADAWEPLLAIADLAGDDWPVRARAAAVSLSCGDDREDSSMGVRLLGDIKNIVTDRDKIAIAELVTELVAIEDAPWGDLNGKPLTTQGLGWRLRPFGVKAKSIKLHGETKRGYEQEQFAEVFARYLGETVTNRYTDTSDTEMGNAFEEGNAFETVTEEETDTAFRYEGNGMSRGNGSFTDERIADTCTLCGSVNIEEYTSDGEPRCFAHFTTPTDGPMVRHAVEQLGLGIVARKDGAGS